MAMPGRLFYGAGERMALILGVKNFQFYTDG